MHLNTWSIVSHFECQKWKPPSWNYRKESSPQSWRHMTLKDYVLYLREYAAHFGISELIRFNVKAAAGGATHFYVLSQSHRSAEVINVQKGCNTKDSYEVPLLCKRSRIIFLPWLFLLLWIGTIFRIFSFPRSFPTSREFPETTWIGPMASMYGIFTYIYHKDQLNVGKYTIHGWYGGDWNRFHLFSFQAILVLKDITRWWRWLSSIRGGWTWMCLKFLQPWTPLIL